MTCQEVRFIPVRFKDAYGPVGAWFLLFKSRATNAFGGEYMVERRPELEEWFEVLRQLEDEVFLDVGIRRTGG